MEVENYWNRNRGGGKLCHFLTFVCAKLIKFKIKVYFYLKRKQKDD